MSLSDSVLCTLTYSCYNLIKKYRQFARAATDSCSFIQHLSTLHGLRSRLVALETSIWLFWEPWQRGGEAASAVKVSRIQPSGQSDKNQGHNSTMTVNLLSEAVPFLRGAKGSKAESEHVLKWMINTENRELISILLFMYMQHVGKDHCLAFVSSYLSSTHLFPHTFLSHQQHQMFIERKSEARATLWPPKPSWSLIIINSNNKTCLLGSIWAKWALLHCCIIISWLCDIYLKEENSKQRIHLSFLQQDAGLPPGCTDHINTGQG